MGVFSVGRANGDASEQRYDQLPVTNDEVPSTSDAEEGEAAEEWSGLQGDAIAEHKPSAAPGVLGLLVPVYIPSFLLFGCNAILTPVLPTFARRTFHVNDAVNGLITSGSNFAGVMIDIPGAVVLARIGPHRAGVLSGVAMIASGLLGGFAQNTPMLFGARFLQGMGHVTWLTSRGLLFAAIDSTVRGKLISLLGGIMRVTSIAMPLLGSFMAASLGYRSVFFAVGLFGVLSLPFSLYELRKEGSWPARTALHNEGVEANRSITDGLPSYGAAAKLRRKGLSVCTGLSNAVRRIAVLVVDNWRELTFMGYPCFVLNLMRTSRDFLFTVAALNHGASQQSIGMLVTTMYLLDFACFPIAGFLMDRFGRKASLCPSLLLMSATFLALGWPRSQERGTLVVLACLAGAGGGMGAGIAMCIGADLSNVAVIRAARNPVQRVMPSKSEFLGLWRFGQDLGQTFGPLLVGVVSHALSLAQAGTVCGLVGLSGLICCVALGQETRDLAEALEKNVESNVEMKAKNSCHFEDEPYNEKGGN